MQDKIVSGDEQVAAPVVSKGKDYYSLNLYKIDTMYSGLGLEIDHFPRISQLHAAPLCTPCDVAFLAVMSCRVLIGECNAMICLNPTFRATDSCKAHLKHVCRVLRISSISKLDTTICKVRVLVERALSTLIACRHAAAAYLVGTRHPSLSPCNRARFHGSHGVACPPPYR